MPVIPQYTSAQNVSGGQLSSSSPTAGVVSPSLASSSSVNRLAGIADKIGQMFTQASFDTLLTDKTSELNQSKLDLSAQIDELGKKDPNSYTSWMQVANNHWTGVQKEITKGVPPILNRDINTKLAQVRAFSMAETSRKYRSATIAVSKDSLARFQDTSAQSIIGSTDIAERSRLFLDVKDEYQKRAGTIFTPDGAINAFNSWKNKTLGKLMQKEIYSTTSPEYVDGIVKDLTSKQNTYGLNNEQVAYWLPRARAEATALAHDTTKKKGESIANIHTDLVNSFNHNTVSYQKALEAGDTTASSWNKFETSSDDRIKQVEAMHQPSSSLVRSVELLRGKREAKLRKLDSIQRDNNTIDKVARGEAPWSSTQSIKNTGFALDRWLDRNSAISAGGDIPTVDALVTKIYDGDTVDVSLDSDARKSLNAIISEGKQSKLAYWGSVQDRFMFLPPSVANKIKYASASSTDASDALAYYKVMPNRFKNRLKHEDRGFMEQLSMLSSQMPFSDAYRTSMDGLAIPMSDINARLKTDSDFYGDVHDFVDKVYSSGGIAGFGKDSPSASTYRFDEAFTRAVKQNYAASNYQHLPAVLDMTLKQFGQFTMSHVGGDSFRQMRPEDMYNPHPDQWDDGYVAKVINADFASQLKANGMTHTDEYSLGTPSTLPSDGGSEAEPVWEILHNGVPLPQARFYKPQIDGTKPKGVESFAEYQKALSGYQESMNSIHYLSP